MHGFTAYVYANRKNRFTCVCVHATRMEHEWFCFFVDLHPGETAFGGAAVNFSVMV